jgi:hypothetical protein
VVAGRGNIVGEKEPAWEQGRFLKKYLGNSILKELRMLPAGVKNLTGAGEKV